MRRDCALRRDRRARDALLPELGATITITPPSEPLLLDGYVLRLPCRDDVEALIRFGDGPDLGATLWVPVPSPCSRAEAEGRLSEFIDGWFGQSAFGPTFVVASASGDEFVGVLFLRAREDEAIEVAYGTAPGHRRRGIATAALLRVSDWCFAQLHARRVELLISAGNLGSLRVAAKAGFEFGGTRRTHVPGTGEEYDDLLYVCDAPRVRLSMSRG